MMLSRRPISVLFLVTVLFAPQPAAADPPKITELRTRQVGDVTYFQVGFESPPGLSLPDLKNYWWFRDSNPELTRLPRLVPQDDAARDVVLSWNFDSFDLTSRSLPRLDGLKFIGKAKGGKATLLLIQPTWPRGKTFPSSLERVLGERNAWVEETVTLDLDKAEEIKGRAARMVRAVPPADDLEGRWALNQVVSLGLLEVQTPEFGFYGLARELVARRYQVPSVSFPTPGAPDNRAHLRLYEITTGAAAVAETMALERLRNPRKEDKPQPRTLDVAKLTGIDIAEHDWVKMMAGKKPAAEPFADLVPHDNYYVAFKHFDKFLELMELASDVGATAGRALSVQSRADHVKERLQDQICLKNTALAKVFGPALIQGVAVTGSDPYVREGSDVTLLFRVNNQALFLAAMKPHIDAARKSWGKQLKEGKADYRGQSIESFVTPGREVSLFRTTLDDVVLCSNSAVALQRIIDVKQMRHKPLSSALDFQYMRTVFRFDDPEEDGFLFLSDAFLRNLVGPALRIKERRRLEALTSMYMVSNAALWAAGENGKLPADHKDLLARTGLGQTELSAPEGTGVFWDAERQMAVSDAYNTIRFATPLIELPIDRATATEAREYEEFRLQYLGLWRRTFDPIGMRFSLRGKEIKWDTFVLPLVQVSQYSELRRWTGGGTFNLDAGLISDKTVAQFLWHFSPEMRAQVRDFLAPPRWLKLPEEKLVGNWLTLRLDDSPAFQKLVAGRIANSLETGHTNWLNADVLDLPLTFGAGIVQPKLFLKTLAEFEEKQGAKVERLKEPYRGVVVSRSNMISPSLYHALIDDAWYVSTSEQSLHDLVDRAILRKEGKLKAKDGPDVNTVFYFAPAAMKGFKPGARLYLEYEAQRTALGNTFLWHPFYRAGLVDNKSTPAQKKETALRFLGYEPVSPEGAPDSYDARSDEVVNKRHGSPRRPILRDGVDPDSPLGKLLEDFAWVRADMRFREDGLHATVTIRRK